MSRGESNRWIKPENKTKDHGMKYAIEKAIILVAFLAIIFVLFLFPKYEAYAMNGEILKEKNNISIGYPEEMTEEKYLGEIESIRENLEESKKNIPESIDPAGLYESLILMAEEAEIELVSVAFKPINTSIDDAVGLRLRTDFLEDENKAIIGPDQRTLGNCPIAVVCIGEMASCVRFLQAVENHRPIIKVKDLGIKGEELIIKTMTLNLESYGILDQASVESLK